jgi:hypothetical protein
MLHQKYLKKYFYIFMKFYELNLYLDNSHNFNIISARRNTVSCLYGTAPDDDQSLVRKVSRVNKVK